MRPWHTGLLELPVGKDAVQLVVVGFADALEVWLGEAVAIVELNPTEETSLPMRKPGHCSRQMSSPKQSLAQRSERSKSQRSSQQTRAKGFCHPPSQQHFQPKESGYLPPQEYYPVK